MAIALPVIAGLAVGIAFILLFSFNSPAFRDTVTRTTRTGDITISLAGLKDRYALNEPPNFTVTYRGYGWFCSDPTAKILNADSGETAYDIPTLELAITCIPEAENIDNTWTLYDIMHQDTPVIIGKQGHYRLEVVGEGVLLERDFFIYDAVLSPKANTPSTEVNGAHRWQNAPKNCQ